MGDIFTNVETLFATYSFAKEVMLVVFGSVFGGVCTVIINKGAIRKQCKFDMQYEILRKEAENIANIYKKIEAVEIGLSFGNGETEPLKTEINEVQCLLLNLNERLRNKRKFVRKYMSSVIVEKSAQCVSDYMNILYTHGPRGMFDFQIISNVNAEKIEELREVEKYFQKLSNDMTEAMETIIAPGIVAKISRKLRKPVMFIEECNAIRKVHKSNRER